MLGKVNQSEKLPKIDTDRVSFPTQYEGRGTRDKGRGTMELEPRDQGSWFRMRDQGWDHAPKRTTGHQVQRPGAGDQNEIVCYLSVIFERHFDAMPVSLICFRSALQPRYHGTPKESIAACATLRQVLFDSLCLLLWRQA